MLMLISVTRLNSRRSRSADIYYGQSKLRWYRCVFSCDRNEPTLQAARILAERLFQKLGADIEKRRDAVLVLERGTDSMSRDDERRLRVGLYCPSSDDKFSCRPAANSMPSERPQKRNDSRALTWISARQGCCVSLSEVLSAAGPQ